MMMKKTLLLLTGLLFAFSASALAAVQEFDAVSVDVPAGWTATAAGPNVTIIADDGSGVIGIALSPSGGQSAEALAKAYGQTVKQENSFYIVEINAQGMKSTQYFQDAGSNILVIVTSGTHSALGGIAKSVKVK
jgi:mevalonate pyrophosphate decarboxylase